MSGRWQSHAFAAAIAIACALIFAPPSAIVFWPDSIAYFSSAEALIERGALVTHQNTPLTTFPPGYPLLVAIARAIGLDRQAAAFLVNLVAAIAIAVLVARIVRARTSNALITVLVLVACLAAGPMPMRYRYAGSELPFIALTLVALDWADRRVWREGLGHAFALGLLCGLIVLTRYSGLAVAGVIGLWLLADVRHGVQRAVRAALSGAAGGAVLVVGWSIRNTAVGSDALGDRRDAITTLGASLTETASSLVDWAMPRVWWADGPLEWLIVFGALLLVAALAYVITRPHQAIHRTVALHLTFAAAYIAFVVLSSTATAIDAINERLLAPAYIPVVLALGLTVHAGLSRLPVANARFRTAFTAALLAVAVALAVFQAYQRPAPEVDFMSAAWRDSPTTRAARELPHSPVCFSNAPGPLYLGTSHRCRRGLTAPYRTEATGVDNVLEWLTSGDARTAYYVWYYHSDPEEMIGDPHALLAGHIVETRRTGDGEILSLVGGVRSAPPGRAAERPSETTRLPRQ